MRTSISADIRSEAAVPIANTTRRSRFSLLRAAENKPFQAGARTGSAVAGTALPDFIQDAALSTGI
jgi:hypothetical protein